MTSKELTVARRLATRILAAKRPETRDRLLYGDNGLFALVRQAKRDMCVDIWESEDSRDERQGHLDEAVDLLHEAERYHTTR